MKTPCSEHQQKSIQPFQIVRLLGASVLRIRHAGVVSLLQERRADCSEQKDVTQHALANYY
jgi:hypothetical protein